MAERRRRLPRAEVENFLSLLQELPIQVEEYTILRVWGKILLLARKEGLSIYDVAHLNLAMRLGLPLATLDQALQKAARNCGVEVF